MGVMVDLQQAHCHQLAEHAAPFVVAQVGADAVDTELVMTPALDFFAVGAAQHVDDMTGAEPLAGAVDG
mgnify:CR=1 FL=1